MGLQNENTISIKNWAEDDQPRSKLINKGKAALSNAELLAILINSGTKSKNAVELSKDILMKCENDLNKLSKLSIKELRQMEGIGEAKAVTIAAAIELGSRRQSETVRRKKQLIASRQVFEYALPLFDGLNFEQFWVIFLDKGNRIITEKLINEGGIAEVHVDLKKILIYALENYSSALICLHNHPSGNLKPSESDIRLTKRLKETAALLDINVLDHVILSDISYFSFADEDLL